MELLLIRHGMTPGNKIGRYIGRTDEALSEEGRALMEERKDGILAFGTPQTLFVSPMLRCRQTAEIIYPGLEQTIVDSLREFDFGIFENKNYKELDGNAEYQAWLDSMCEAPVPEGESMESFKARCIEGLEEVLMQCAKNEKKDRVALVVHGGTIMSLMDVYAEPKKGYYEWSVKNGEGYLIELDLEKWQKGVKLFQSFCVIKPNGRL